MAVYTAIDDPEAYFQTVIYTGDGAANHAITLGADTDMQPDLVWIKNRDAADAHCMFDVIRGVTKLISSNIGTAETTDTDTLDSFATDGFQVDADVKVNTDTEDYGAWCWKAGTSETNTNGDQDGTISKSTVAGFSIVKSTTASSGNFTWPHGLDSAPELILRKPDYLNSTMSWDVYHIKNTAAPETDALVLNTNAATSDATGPWNDTAPTSTVISSQSAHLNTDVAQIAYCWHGIQGFSKFGSYTGNGNADGPFVYTGFLPSFVIFKQTDATGGWFLKTAGHGTFYNPVTNNFKADTADAENTSGDFDIDFLSNGIKIRNTDAIINASGGDYIFMAWASAPFVNSNGVPCNAR